MFNRKRKAGGRGFFAFAWSDDILQGTSGLSPLVTRGCTAPKKLGEIGCHSSGKSFPLSPPPFPFYSIPPTPPLLTVPLFSELYHCLSFCCFTLAMD